MLTPFSRASTRVYPARGDVSHICRCRRQRKTLPPESSLREHQKVTPGQAGIATLPGYHHGADRRLRMAYNRAHGSAKEQVGGRLRMFEVDADTETTSMEHYLPTGIPGPFAAGGSV